MTVKELKELLCVADNEATVHNIFKGGFGGKVDKVRIFNKGTKTDRGTPVEDPHILLYTETPMYGD